MKSKDQKKKDIADLHELLEKAPNIFLAAFEKLSVDQDFKLRRAVRDAGGRYRVVKNTLVENAAKETPSESSLSGLTGMNSLAYTEADPVALAKVLTDYAKENPTFTFKAGVVEGRVIDASGIQALAALPSKEEIFAKLLFLIQAPATSLVRALNGVGRNLAVVLDQGVKEKKFSE